MGKHLWIINGRVLVDGTFVASDLSVRDGNIEGIFGCGMHLTDDGMDGVDVIDAAGGWVLPGFIDIHTHGAVGVDFNHATTEEVRKVSAFFASHGVTAYLPTVLTDTMETMCGQLAILSDPALLASCPQIVGIHLEGPFLSRLYKGAMPEHLLQSCDIGIFDTLQTAARGKIRLVTLAPELPGALELVSELFARGIKVSLGHSAASYEQGIAAIARGACSATHVMNAMKLLHMHDPAILTAVLESDIHAEMICDGFHLHPPIVRLLLKIKGLDRMIACTDSIMATGCPEGKYQLGQTDIVVKDGDAKVVSTGVRAGSTLTMDQAVRNIKAFTTLPLEKISPLVSKNPAELLGLPHQVGSLAAGSHADITVLNVQLEPILTVVRGTIVYQESIHGR